MSKRSGSLIARAGSAGKIASGLLLPILAGFFLGNYLDKQLGSAPWMALLLIMLGVVAGFGWLYKISTEDEDDE
ncbi:AtpZ/AtpI family protein [Candidatus Poribacteria bacterium]